MFSKTATIFSTLFVALLILSITLVKSAQVNYAFSGEVRRPYQTPVVLEDRDEAVIDYNLAYPGKVLPDSSLWFFKAARDRAWLWLTTSDTRRAELLLHFADKRLGAAKILFEEEKPESAFSTLSKSGKYLESAAKNLEENTKRGLDTAEFAQDLSKASLKHKEVIEELKLIAPEDAKPKINEIENYAEDSFKTSRDILRSQGIDAPQSPLDWD